MHPEIEKLIDIALADGQITEKERNVILKKATELGVDTDEVDTLDGKLHQLEANKPKQKEKVGNIKTCPACGASVKAFTTKCSDCGHEFRGIEESRTVNNLHNQLLEIEKKVRNSESSKGIQSNFMSGPANELMLQRPIMDAKASIIQTFPIPNTKEDLLEFLILAKSNVSGISIGFVDKLIGSQSHRINYKKAWLAKCEQVIMKARFSMKDDKNTLEEIEFYAKQLGIK